VLSAPVRSARPEAGLVSGSGGHDNPRSAAWRARPPGRCSP